MNEVNKPEELLMTEIFLLCILYNDRKLLIFTRFTHEFIHDIRWALFTGLYSHFDFLTILIQTHNVLTVI